MKAATKTIEDYLSQLEDVSLHGALASDLYAMLTIAKCIATGALARETSIGAHYIENENI